MGVSTTVATATLSQVGLGPDVAKQLMETLGDRGTNKDIKGDRSDPLKEALADQIKIKLHGWLRSQFSSYISGPITGIFLAGPDTTEPTSAAENCAIAACAAWPSNREHIFFQDEDGGIRQIKYEPDSGRYIGGGSSSRLILADNAKLGTPLAAVGYEVSSKKCEKSGKDEKRDEVKVS
ncbi:hypothetical protein ABW20_dc0106567 [Dactylellina cionopaga]|nr:hypothetical protein ABW20_dc0106567 [Dactylellina cionopaga]